MRAHYLLAAILTCLLSSVVISAESAPSSKVIARVNGAPITDEELKLACLAEFSATEGWPEPLRSERLKEVLHRELDKLIERELLMSDAEKWYARRPKARARLQQAAAAEFERDLGRYKRFLKQSKATSDDDEHLREALAEQGIRFQLLQRNIERNFMAMEYAKGLIAKDLHLRPEEMNGHRSELDKAYKRIIDELKSEATIEITLEQATR
jgi:hypothetical protein